MGHYGLAVNNYNIQKGIIMTTQPALRVERKNQSGDSGIGIVGGGLVLLTPAIDEDYWQYRVIVGEHQAVVGFPKFGLIGIGFAVEEEDWNVNLPHGTPPEKLFAHIKKNKGDKNIPDERCIEAIRLIDQAVREDKACTCRRCSE